jgi:hypothetical protein
MQNRKKFRVEQLNEFEDEVTRSARDGTSGEERKSDLCRADSSEDIDDGQQNAASSSSPSAAVQHHDKGQQGGLAEYPPKDEQKIFASPPPFAENNNTSSKAAILSPMELARTLHQCNSNFSAAECLDITEEGNVTYPPKLRLQCIYKTNVVRASVEKLFPTGSFSIGLTLILDDRSYNARRREDAELQFGEANVRSVKLAPIHKLKVSIRFELGALQVTDSVVRSAPQVASDVVRPAASSTATTDPMSASITGPRAEGEDAKNNNSSSFSGERPVSPSDEQLLAQCYLTTCSFDRVCTSQIPLCVLCPSAESFHAFVRNSHRMVLEYSLTFPRPVKSVIRTSGLAASEVDVDQDDPIVQPESGIRSFGLGMASSAKKQPQQGQADELASHDLPLLVSVESPLAGAARKGSNSMSPSPVRRAESRRSATDAELAHALNEVSEELKRAEELSVSSVDEKDQIRERSHHDSR